MESVLCVLFVLLVLLLANLPVLVDGGFAGLAAYLHQEAEKTTIIAAAFAYYYLIRYTRCMLCKPTGSFITPDMLKPIIVLGSSQLSFGLPGMSHKYVTVLNTAANKTKVTNVPNGEALRKDALKCIRSKDDPFAENCKDVSEYMKRFEELFHHACPDGNFEAVKAKSTAEYLDLVFKNSSGSGSNWDSDEKAMAFVETDVEGKIAAYQIEKNQVIKYGAVSFKDRKRPRVSFFPEDGKALCCGSRNIPAKYMSIGGKVYAAVEPTLVLQEGSVVVPDIDGEECEPIPTADTGGPLTVTVTAIPTGSKPINPSSSTRPPDRHRFRRSVNTSLV